MRVMDGARDELESHMQLESMLAHYFAMQTYLKCWNWNEKLLCFLVCRSSTHTFSRSLHN